MRVLSDPQRIGSVDGIVARENKVERTQLIKSLSDEGGIKINIQGENGYIVLTKASLRENEWVVAG